jgi:hypothetical protein
MISFCRAISSVFAAQCALRLAGYALSSNLCNSMTGPLVTYSTMRITITDSRQPLEDGNQRLRPNSLRIGINYFGEEGTLE